MGHHHEGVAPVEGGRVPRRAAHELEGRVRPIRVVRDAAEAIGVAATRIADFAGRVPDLQRQYALPSHDGRRRRALEIDGIDQTRGSRGHADAVRPADSQRRCVRERVTGQNGCIAHGRTPRPGRVSIRERSCATDTQVGV